MPEGGNPQDLNRYTYARSDPLAYTDPSGHYALLEDAQGPFGAFSLYETSAGWRLLSGGSHFRNYYEHVAGEYFLAGGAGALPGDAGQSYNATITGPIANAYTEVAGGTASEVGLAMQDVGALYGASYVLAKGLETGVQAGAALVGGVLGSSGRGSATPYEVGTYHDLKSRSGNDKLDIHHTPQAHAAGQAISGYVAEDGPAIALPEGEHGRILPLKGGYGGTARELLARDLWQLHEKTGAPNSALQQLADMNKAKYEGAFGK